MNTERRYAHYNIFPHLYDPITLYLLAEGHKLTFTWTDLGRYKWRHVRETLFSLLIDRVPLECRADYICVTVDLTDSEQQKVLSEFVTTVVLMFPGQRGAMELAQMTSIVE